MLVPRWFAYWRHMPKAERHEMILEQLQPPVKAVSSLCFGGTEFKAPRAAEGRYLGTRDLMMKFELCSAVSNVWTSSCFFQ